MRSSTSSFLFAVRFGSGLTRVGGLGSGGERNRTFKDVWGIYFFRVALFGYGDLVRDLDKVDAGGEICDAARHDREELMTMMTTRSNGFVDYESERDY
jgi:hypothetical protein